MPQVTKRWVIEQGIGHYELSLGNITLSCDEGEFRETEKELEDIYLKEAS